MNVDHRYYIPPNTGDRDDRPAARLPEARRPAGARLRPLPPHRLRPLPQRAAAALPRGAEGPPRRRASRCSRSRSSSVRSSTASRSAAAARAARRASREIQSYVGLGANLKPGHLFRVTIDNLTDVRIRPTRRSVRRRATSRPRSTASCIRTSRVSSRANDAALGIKPKAPKQNALKPAQITTLVLNGTTIAGLARDTSYKLARRRLPHGAAAGDDPRRHTDAELLRELRLLRLGAAEREGRGAPAEGVDGAEHRSRAAAAADRDARAAGGQPARDRRRRHRVRRRARQSAGAHRPGAAAPAAERSQRPRRVTLVAAGGAREGAVPRSWSRT